MIASGVTPESDVATMDEGLVMAGPVRDAVLGFTLGVDLGVHAPTLRFVDFTNLRDAPLS